MTAADLAALLNSDLGDEVNRLVLADALEDEGRDVEATLARRGEVQAIDGIVCPRLRRVDGGVMEDGTAFVNASWNGWALGGYHVTPEGGATPYGEAEAFWHPSSAWIGFDLADPLFYELVRLASDRLADEEEGKANDE